MWTSSLFILIILCEWSSQNKILEHFEQKLNSINDRIRQTSHLKPYRGKVKRYRCIEEYVTIDEFGNVIEDSVEERKYFTTHQPPKVYESVTQLPPKSIMPEGLSYMKSYNRLHGVKSMNSGLISTSQYPMPLSTHKLRRKKKKKSKYSKSKLTKIEIKGKKKFYVFPSALTSSSTTAIPKTTVAHMDDESQNDLLIEKLFLASTTMKPSRFEFLKKAASSPQTISTKQSSRRKIIVQEESQQNPIRSQTKKTFIRPSIPKEFYEYFIRDHPNKPNYYSSPTAVLDGLYVTTEIRRMPAKKLQGENEVNLSQPIVSKQNIPLPASDDEIIKDTTPHPPIFPSLEHNGIQEANEIPKNTSSDATKAPMRFPVRVQPKLKPNKDGKSALPRARGSSHSPHMKMNALPLASSSSNQIKKNPPAQLSPLPSISGNSVIPPAAMEKIRTENCAKIPAIASQFGITDVPGWARKNCNLLRMFAPGATCQQIWNFIDSCKKSNFF